MSRLLSYPGMRDSTMRPRWLALALFAATTFAAGLSAACGDDGGSENSGGAGGSDDAYVASMCEAYDSFADTFAKLLNERITQDPSNSPKSPKEALQLYVIPFENLVSGMEDANPPNDVKKHHADMVKALKSTLKKANDGDTNAFAALASPQLRNLPADVKARLNEAARVNTDCQDASFSFQ